MGLWSQVKKKIKKIPGAADLITALETSTAFGLEVAESAITQNWDYGHLVDDAADSINAALEASDEVAALVQAQAMIWVSMAVSMITASIANGSLGDQINGRIGAQIASIRTAIQPMMNVYTKEADRINGIINNTQVQLFVSAAQDANRIGLIVSPAYRAQVEKLFDATRQVSREVFGDASTLQGALSVFQLMTYDLGALTGEKVDISNTKYFAGAVDITNYVADHSRSYARNPEAFWYDFNRLWINPAQQERVQELQRQSGLIQAVSTALGTAAGKLDAFETRYDLYRKAVDPLLSEQNLTFLDRLHRTFDREYAQPFKSLDTYVKSRFPPVETQVDDLTEKTQNLEVRLQSAEIVTTDPAQLRVDQRAAQAQRINSILDSSLVLPAETGAERFRQQGERIKGILEQLEGK